MNKHMGFLFVDKRILFHKHSREFVRVLSGLNSLRFNQVASVSEYGYDVSISRKYG